MKIETIDEQEEYRLVRCGDRYAVVEVRDGHVLSLHRHDRREGKDTQKGLAEVIGEDGWTSEDSARNGFRALVEEEVHWAEIIW